MDTADIQKLVSGEMVTYQAWYGQKPDLGRFRVFGCRAYVFVQADERKKLESHMQKCVFVGYPAEYFRYLQGTKDYKLTYAKGEDGLAFTTYCDASHGDCVDTGWSTGAYLTCLGGGAIGGTMGPPDRS
ncbi:hypothetical protein MD484_g7184, partial [Candolleomyces efflorescens]